MALTREQLAQRVAQEFQDGYYINLGIGIPTLAANYLPEGVEVMLQSENGLLGMGPFPLEDEVDPDLINAGKQTVTMARGASLFSSADSFAMIRGGHVDLTVLGAFEVDCQGNIASYMIPGKLIKGMGGAMDLVSGVKKVVVMMEHNAKDGSPKVLEQCDLPITGQKVVDLLVSDKGVFSIDAERGMTLIEISPFSSLDEIRAATGCVFDIAPDIKGV